MYPNPDRRKRNRSHWLRKGDVMECKEIIDRLRNIKTQKKYTLHDLSKKLDIQITTMERWFKTNRMNKLYAEVISQRLDDL